MSWLVPFAPIGERPVLVCLPQAGSGCGVFRSWQERHADLTVVGVQLPGRENRFTGTFADAVAEIVAALVATVSAGQRIVLFGHSLGGLLGYEVAKALPESRTPEALVVAASRPPHLSGRAAGSMGVSATYTDPGGAPVPCPLHAWGGADDEIVTADHVEAWAGYTEVVFHSRQFAGGHDFCLDSAAVPAALRALFSRSRQGV